MAEPLKILSSLDQVADRYAVFENNQVLTPGQLNSVSSFLDDQDRLTRVNLIGVGIVAGLWPALSGNGVRVGRGLGVTTDGDLLTLAEDAVFTHWKPYAADAPHYAPFHPDPDSADTRIELSELVAEGDSAAQPLSRLPGDGLSDKVALLLMESVVTGSDRCNGTACDNLGGDALFRQRMLLARRADVDAWLARAATDAARALPELAASRPSLDRSIASTDLLAKRYRDADGATLARIAGAFRQLAATSGALLAELFGTAPADRWIAWMERQASASAGTQAWHEFLKDVVDTWNELRDALAEDRATPLPAVAAFPKHLLLGDLSSPGQRRTGLQPSPIDAIAREAAARARFLLRRLDALLASFTPPAAGALRITPSLGAVHPLGERAIPAYYGPERAARACEAWNFRLSARDQSGHNLGYHAERWAASDRARAPLAFAIDRHDVFRVEGHLGQSVEAVVADARRQIAAHNLPFEVQAVLLHGEHRGKIRVRPEIRYTSLHSLHHLVRKDVSTRIDEGATFGAQYVGRIQEAIAQKTIPNEENTSIDTARSASTAINAIQAVAAPVLAKANYSAYRTDASWKAGVPAAFEAIGNASATLGGISRTDFTSPYDALISSNHVRWLEWLDALIDARDDRADARLLFSAFLGRHPGMEHIGGVRRGGTWVVVYNDAGKVVADFSLSYPAAETEEPEPQEPPLKTIPKPPVLIDRPVRVIPPIDLRIKNAFVDVRTEWNKELSIHSANLEGITRTILTWQGNANIKGTTGLTGDKRLDGILEDVRFRHDAVLEAASRATQPGISDDERRLAAERLKKSQDDLAVSLGRAAEHLVTNQVDLSSGQAAAAAPLLVGSMGLIKDAEASKAIKNQLTDLRANAGTSQQSVLDSMAVVGGFQLRRG